MEIFWTVVKVKISLGVLAIFMEWIYKVINLIKLWSSKIMFGVLAIFKEWIIKLYFQRFDLREKSINVVRKAIEIGCQWQLVDVAYYMPFYLTRLCMRKLPLYIDSSCYISKLTQYRAVSLYTERTAWNTYGSLYLVRLDIFIL